MTVSTRGNIRGPVGPAGSPGSTPSFMASATAPTSGSPVAKAGDVVIVSGSADPDHGKVYLTPDGTTWVLQVDLVGPAGSPGAGFTLRGTVTAPPVGMTLPDGSAAADGDAVVVQGSATPAQDGHLWSLHGGTWADLGSLAGPAGPHGAAGAQGPAVTFGAPTVTAGSAGSAAAVTSSGVGTAGDPTVLAFTLPRGADGHVGADSIVPGPKGDDSIVAGPSGADGHVGAKGADGSDGAAGPRGAKWFTAATDPTVNPTGSQVGDFILNTVSGEIFEVTA